ncbi:hypothetical protein [Candidatus Brachybacter algidus]|uniref:hypothetical protein n=1 Tax=Candidatus Brachybacter algidus TaxID=2982024 RepID=UPI00257EAB7B|nr:hypothetical protein [Candidatus Brachybacter algidus]
MTALFALIICIVSVILFTQTSLIRFLGPLPKSLVGEDYKKSCHSHRQSGNFVPSKRTKFKAIQNLITRVNTTPDIKEEKQVESTIKKWKFQLKSKRN